MPHELPDCPHCHAPSDTFTPGGLSSGPGYLNRGFGCPCGAWIQYTERPGGNLMVFFTEDQLVPREDLGEGVKGFPQAYQDWLDDAVFPTWRYRTRNLTSIFVPPKTPDELAVFVRVMKEGGVGWAQITGELREVSRNLKVPEDPVVTDNRLFLDTVFARLAHQIGTHISYTEIDNRYTPSGTKGVPNWVEFELGDSTFRMGWRKRVVAIQVTTPQGLPIEAIEPIAKADRVTFSVLGKPLHIATREAYATYLERVLQADIDRGCEGESLERTRRILATLVEGFPEEGGKDVTDLPEPGLAHRLEIHAWSLDKTVEYLTVLCQAALAS